MRSSDKLGFRHGAIDPRPYNVNPPESAEVTTGKCNMIFMDNHAAAVDYRTFITWKPNSPVPSHYSNARYAMFLRGFDAFR